MFKGKNRFNLYQGQKKAVVISQLWKFWKKLAIKLSELPYVE